MAHARVTNHTPFAFDHFFLADESGRPIVVTVVKATFEIRSHMLVLADEQVPIDMAGQRNGDAESSSYKYEPEIAFIKPATDVVLVGNATAPRANTREMGVTFKVGSLQRSLNVVGDRVWLRKGGRIEMSSPESFEVMPLQYERAFGGTDDSVEGQSPTELRNPAGVGFRSDPNNFVEGTRLPNIEEPAAPIQNYGDRPPPAGVGFVSPHWQPRAALGGTFDAEWTDKRMPLLPEDFDRRYFNAASAGLVASGYLAGDEPVTIHGAAAGSLGFKLPGGEAPRCQVSLVSEGDVELETKLDTVIVNSDELRLFMLWRAHTPVTGAHDLRSAVVSAPTLR